MEMWEEMFKKVFTTEGMSKLAKVIDLTSKVESWENMKSDYYYDRVDQETHCNELIEEDMAELLPIEINSIENAIKFLNERLIATRRIKREYKRKDKEA